MKVNGGIRNVTQFRINIRWRLSVDLKLHKKRSPLHLSYGQKIKESDKKTRGKSINYITMINFKFYQSLTMTTTIIII